jgi:hypothetical protein
VPAAVSFFLEAERFNRFGSRVYFDDLGPPWPKHPCTDKPSSQRNTIEVPKPIVKRARGLATELVDAARIIGRHPEESSWCLMQVEDVAAEKDGKRVKLKGLELETDLLVIFIVSPDCNLEKDDIVSVADGQISYFDMTVFKPRTVAARQTSIEEHWKSAHWAVRVRVQVATGNGIYRIPVQQGLGVTSPGVRTDCASGNTRAAIAVAVHAPPARAVWIVIVAGHNLSRPLTPPKTPSSLRRRGG